MKLELNIPTHINEIPLINYKKFIEVSKNSTDEEFIAQKMVELFCGIELKEVVKISLNDLNRLVEHFHKIFEQKPDFINRFELQGVEFGFIPNIEKISTGEYSDLDTYINDLSTLNNALAVMYRPVTKKLKDKYEIEQYESSYNYSEAMDFCPLGIALAAQVFFCDLGNDLLEAIPNFLENKLKKMNIQASTNSENNGDGITHSMHLLKEILQDSKLSENLIYTNPLHGLVTKFREKK